MNHIEEDDQACEGLGDPSEFYAGLMKEVVPEKSLELQGVLSKHSVKFCMNESEKRIYFRAAPTSGLITVGLQGTTRLMAHAFAYTSAHSAQCLKILNERNRTPALSGIA